jgi:hypothetical protein
VTSTHRRFIQAETEGAVKKELKRILIFSSKSHTGFEIEPEFWCCAIGSARLGNRSSLPTRIGSRLNPHIEVQEIH